MATVTRVVLDCDPGHDDALAILLAAASPTLRLEAITTVAGNQTLEKVTLNARRVCTAAGITTVPIAAGCDRPLVRELAVAAEIHGASGLDGPAWGDLSVDVDERHAVDLIVDLGMEAGVTIIATGPLTNVATALRREPALAGRLGGVVVMGGAIGLGNWTPSAEFNIYADPEAAAEVVAAGIPLTLIPLEVTHQALATPERMTEVRSIGSRVSRMTEELIEYFAATYRSVFGFAYPPVHDACAVAAVIDPTTVATRRMHVAIETESDLTRGRTSCDVYGTFGTGSAVDVGLELDADRFWNLMIGALATYRD